MLRNAFFAASSHKHAAPDVLHTGTVHEDFAPAPAGRAQTQLRTRSSNSCFLPVLGAPWLLSQSFRTGTVSRSASPAPKWPLFKRTPECRSARIASTPTGMGRASRLGTLALGPSSGGPRFGAQLATASLEATQVSTRDPPCSKPLSWASSFPRWLHLAARHLSSPQASDER